MWEETTLNECIEKLKKIGIEISAEVPVNISKILLEILLEDEIYYDIKEHYECIKNERNSWISGRCTIAIDELCDKV